MKTWLLHKLSPEFTAKESRLAFHPRCKYEWYSMVSWGMTQFGLVDGLHAAAFVMIETRRGWQMARDVGKDALEPR
jgi:hypothetical protein